jgi:hypothetical protein
MAGGGFFLAWEELGRTDVYVEFVEFLSFCGF